MSSLTIEVKNDGMIGRTTEKALHVELIKKDNEIKRLNNIINECATDILRELEENNHLSYSVALAISQKLLGYKELKGEDKE